jgi:TPR repeat protein
MRIKQGNLDLRWQRADKEWEAGNLRGAFRMFLSCAKMGSIGCQVNVGTFYADGIGIKPNRERALYWYRRAYRRRDKAAAFNAGMLLRDEGKEKRALAWFERAAGLGHGDAHVEIAKLHLKNGDQGRAREHLRLAMSPGIYIFDDSRAEAQRLLKSLSKSKGHPEAK